MKRAIVLGLVGCGRIAFDPIGGDDAGGGSGGDGPSGMQLVAHYPLDIDGSDISGNGLDGICNVTGCPVVVPGRVGMAMQFDGTDDYYQVDDDPLLRMPVFTVSLWIFPTSATGFQTPIVKTLATGVGGSFELAIGMVENIFCTTPGMTLEDCLVFTPQAPQDTWTHIAMTLDGVNKRAYVNGVEISSEPVTTTIYDASPMLIGRDVEDAIPRGHWPGLIDEIRIYDRALTATEILPLFAVP